MTEKLIALAMLCDQIQARLVVSGTRVRIEHLYDLFDAHGDPYDMEVTYAAYGGGSGRTFEEAVNLLWGQLIVGPYNFGIKSCNQIEAKVTL